jgi:hypothetical protein
MRKDAKTDLSPLIESGEPVVIVVLSQRGLEKSFVFYEDENVEALEAGNLLLARISPQLTLIDNALRTG